MFDQALPHGWHYYFRSRDVAEHSDEVIDIVVDHSLRMRSPVNAPDLPARRRGRPGWARTRRRSAVAARDTRSTSMPRP
ncbi:MAG TPA: hypothetical protein VI122_17910 [Thermoleophilaceae bacterium]